MGVEILVPLGFFAMVTSIAVGVPLVKAFARRVEQQASQPTVPSEVLARLERMEQAIESVAIEVERISEGQRFTTRLLSERGGNGSDAVRGDRADQPQLRGGGQ